MGTTAFPEMRGKERRAVMRRADDNGETMKEPRPFPWAIIAISLTVLVQFATMIWWGATLTAGFSSLRETMGEFKGAIAIFATQMNTQAVKMGVLEAKMDVMREEQQTPPPRR